jgi:hypothetical protein
MVVQIHTGEFYYIGPGGSVLDTPAAHWVGWLNSLFRSCIPLFVMISGVFLFPVRNEGGCCCFSTNRREQRKRWCELPREVMDAEVGPVHPQALGLYGEIDGLQEGINRRLRSWLW